MRRLISMDYIRTSFHLPGGDQKKNYYVYIHKDLDGQVFYVGKGKGKRAWSKSITERHGIWHRYVEKLNGKYQVEIIKDNMSEDEAVWFEEDLMSKYGGQLVNWSNLHRSADFERQKQYWKYRKENDLLLDEAKKTESIDLERAISLYKQALKAMKESDSLGYNNEYYTGLALVVYQEIINEFRTGNIYILDRLTVCLKKLGRKGDIVKEVKDYLNMFPAAANIKTFSKIMKRAGVTE